MYNKYPRSYHIPGSPGTTSDDRIAKSVEQLLGVDMILTEKLDGENNDLNILGAYSRSHATFTTHPWCVKSWEIQRRIKNDLSEGVSIFGENMYAIHSIEYTSLTSPFYMFGVRDNDMWLSWDEVEEYSFLLDIPTVPVLFKGVVNTEKEFYELIGEFTKQPSKLGSDIMEGVVARVAHTFHNDNFSTSLMKWVRKDHVQTDEHWTRNWKKANIHY